MQIDPVDSKNSFRFNVALQTKKIISKIQGILRGPKKSSDITNKTFLFEELQ